MGKKTDWNCACEKEKGTGNKCPHCEEAIVNDIKNHNCSYLGTCVKK